MVRIMLSKYCEEADARNSLRKGDNALHHGKVMVTIDSEPMRHAEAPGDGMGYECIFHDTGERSFASSDHLKIIRPSDYNSAEAIAMRSI
jgi:hypothetical protein